MAESKGKIRVVIDTATKISLVLEAAVERGEISLDHLMDEQNKTLDYAARKKIFDEVQEILSEQQPMIFTVTPYYYCALRSDIGNARPTPLSSYRATWNMEELYFKK